MEYSVPAIGWVSNIYYPRVPVITQGSNYVQTVTGPAISMLELSSKVWTETESTGYGVYTYENTSDFKVDLLNADYDVKSSVILAIILLFSFNTIIFADTVDYETFNNEVEADKEVFDNLLDDLSKNIAKKMLLESEDNSLQRSNSMIELENNLKDIELQVESLDNADILTDDEAYEFIQENHKDTKI
ncbi:MAG: hypothetical protein ACK5JH_13265 [Anaerocolumna sp.]